MNFFWLEEDMVVGPFVISGELRRSGSFEILSDWLCGEEVGDPGTLDTTLEKLIEFVGTGADLCLIVHGSPKHSRVKQLAEHLQSPFLLVLSRGDLYFRTNSFSNFLDAGIGAYLSLNGKRIALYHDEAGHLVVIQDIDLTELKHRLVLTARDCIMAASGFDPMRVAGIETLVTHVEWFIEERAPAGQVSWRFADQEISLDRENLHKAFMAVSRDYAVKVLDLLVERGVTSVAVPARLDGLLGLSDCSQKYTRLRVQTISRADEVAAVLKLISFNAFEDSRDSVVVRSLVSTSNLKQSATVDMEHNGGESISIQTGRLPRLMTGLVVLTLVNFAAGAYLLTEHYGMMKTQVLSDVRQGIDTGVGKLIVELQKRAETLEKNVARLQQVQEENRSMTDNLLLKDRVVDLEGLTQKLSAETEAINRRVDNQLPVLATQVESIDGILSNLRDDYSKQLYELRHNGATSEVGALQSDVERLKARIDAITGKIGDKSIVAIFDNGKAQASLGNTDKGGFLQINNSRGQPVVQTSANSNGNGSLYLKDLRGDKTAVLTNNGLKLSKSGNKYLNLRYDGQGGEILVYDRNNTRRLFIGPADSGKFCLAIFEKGSSTFKTQFCDGADIAEVVRPVAGEWLEPGMVVEIASTDATGLLARPTNQYASTRVIGVVSGAGGLHPAVTLNSTGVVGEVPVAIGGTVYTKADASGGPIQPGDLLVSSSKPGHATRIDPGRAPVGAVIGRAIDRLPEGMGLIRIWTGGG
ncbi:MAG: hypothetical protein ABW144_19825 [Candidatus Thiodiazotropha sp.]